jgi:hypothetical protein
VAAHNDKGYFKRHFNVKRRHKIKTIKNMTPGHAIRAFCVKCVGGVLGDVKKCGGDGKNPTFDTCSFFPYRMGRGRPSVKIIRKFCLQCMGDSPSLVRECTTTYCNCYPYRFGTNPTLAGKGRGRSAEAMDAIRPKRQGPIKEISSQNRLSAMR